MADIADYAHTPGVSCRPLSEAGTSSKTTMNVERRLLSIELGVDAKSSSFAVACSRGDTATSYA